MGIFHHADDTGNRKIMNFPKPFDKPDLVILQSFYIPEDCRIAYYCTRHRIPYIIVPRGALTQGAQKKKKAKKALGNLLMFARYARNAAAIQYLTEQEHRDSGDRWNKKHIIIPNGVKKKRTTKTWTDKAALKGVFIGRLDIFHKGIDLLIHSCYRNRRLMIDSQCTIDIYGPWSNDSAAISNLIVAADLGSVIQLKDELHGQDKERVLLDSDFFVLTSRFEGHPTGLLEALSYGLPCLITRGTNMLDEVVEFDAGWTAEATIECLSETLRTLIIERRCLERKGTNALALSSQYAWDVLAEKSHCEYSRVLNEL